MPTIDTYSITYQYKAREWQSHNDLDEGTADALLHLCCMMGRDCRVRQNATGRVEVVMGTDKAPLTLLHLFFKSISGRCGKVTD